MPTVEAVVEPPRHAGIPPTAARRRLPMLGDVLPALGVAINVMVVLLARHFPYQDGANHLARYVLLQRAWLGDAPAGVHARLLPTSYVGLDLVGVALVQLLSPAAALRLISILAVVLLPAGMYALLRHTAPRRRGWALAGALLGFSWYLLDGLLNFVVGAGLALLWLAWWWPHRERASWARRAALAAGAAALFLVHLSAPLAVLVVVWTDWALAIVARLRARAAPAARAGSLRSRALTSLLLAAVVFALWTWVELALGPAHGAAEQLEFRDVASKVAALGAPFYAFSVTQMAVLALAWAVSLLAFAYVNRATLGADAILVASFLFLVLYVISPRNIGSAGGVDVRWLLFAFLLPFCATDARAGRPARAQDAALALVLLACAVHAGVVMAEVRRRDRALDAFDRVLALVPRGARLLPVIADGDPRPRVGTYQEYAFWHVIRNAGKVPGLFNLRGTRPHDPRFTHFAHFELRDAASWYQPPFAWGTATFVPLDWTLVGRDYDDIVQAGADPRVTAYLRAHARERARDGAITLYEVEHPR